MKTKKSSALKPKRGGGGTKRGNKSSSISEDPFFAGDESKKRRKFDNDAEIIDSGESGDDYGGIDGDAGGKGEGEEAVEEDEFADETADERRKRFAVSHLEKLKEFARREKEDEDDDEEDEDDDGDRRRGERDSLVAQMLNQKQLEDSGRVRRSIASRVQEPEASDQFRVLVKHRQSVTAVALSDDDLKGFSASKDGIIMHWDLDSGKSDKYRWPSTEVLKSHGAKDPQGRATKQSKTVSALAVSSDGRYLATGGLDRHIHLWDTRTREHIQAFTGHRGPISCLAFRQGTCELFSGSYDRTVRIWNVEDRTYINSLYGHQSEILAIDCLRKERVLAVGRDMTMQLFKVPEEKRSVFRAPSALECCCFIDNDNYFSGSADGSVELWHSARKKPVSIVRNAHALPAANGTLEKDLTRIPNGHAENGDKKAKSLDSSSAFSWVGSVALCRGSDLAVSGAGNGSVRLWSIESERRDIQPLFDLPLVGFVNSLAFAKSGEFLVAGVGQEPRLGRWGRIAGAQNGVAVHSLKLS